jgi:hypothetical protein
VPVLVRFEGAPGVTLRPGMSARVTARTGAALASAAAGGSR